ncbi:MAG TPA: hypothetical protein VH044_05225 [Polyangiaceae bacterium]|jgi:hypothetical protein|nr:hypothetical protein [Polyangiaceae bacterium]
MNIERPNGRARAVVLCGALLGVTCSASARADGQTPAPPAATRATPVEEVSYAPPNRAILAGGIAGFLGAYIPSFIVALANGNSFDNQLYIPVAGPWMDLAKRPTCGTGPTQISCVTEDAYEVLLVVDGVFQALGVGAIALGALTPEKRTRTVGAIVRAKGEDKPHLRLVPTVGKTGCGLAVFGGF